MSVTRFGALQIGLDGQLETPISASAVVAKFSKRLIVIPMRTIWSAGDSVETIQHRQEAGNGRVGRANSPYLARVL